MPVIYQIDDRSGIIRTKCVGAVTLDEVIGHFRTLVLDPVCPDRLDVILDLREMTSVPTADQLRAVSEEIARVRARVSFGACAVVASSDALFGTAKIFEVFSARGFAATTVVRGPSEAEGWLASRRARKR